MVAAVDDAEQPLPSCPKIYRRPSGGLTVIEVEEPAEARAMGDLAICPVFHFSPRVALPSPRRTDRQYCGEQASYWPSLFSLSLIKTDA
jgi:hypothetical protein